MSAPTLNYERGSGKTVRMLDHVVDHVDSGGECIVIMNSNEQAKNASRYVYKELDAIGSDPQRVPGNMIRTRHGEVGEVKFLSKNSEIVNLKERTVRGHKNRYKIFIDHYAIEKEIDEEFGEVLEDAFRYGG